MALVMKFATALTEPLEARIKKLEEALTLCEEYVSASLKEVSQMRKTGNIPHLFYLEALTQMGECITFPLELKGVNLGR
jgi:hypothetical protein